MTAKELDQRMKQLSQQAIKQAKAVVEQAPDGQWVAASEWEVREIFQKLTRECYQLLLQVRADAHAAAPRAAFSP